jgi:hypothetical protein
MTNTHGGRYPIAGVREFELLPGKQQRLVKSG